MEDNKEIKKTFSEWISDEALPATKTILTELKLLNYEKLQVKYDKLKEDNALLIETLKKVKDDYFWNKYIEGMQVINNDTRVREILETNELLNKIKEVLQKVENK